MKDCSMKTKAKSYGKTPSVGKSIAAMTSAAKPAMPKSKPSAKASTPPAKRKVR